MPEIPWFEKVFDTKKCVKLIFSIEIGQNMELCFEISNKSFSCQTPKIPTKRKPQTHPEQAAKNRQLMLHSSRSGQEEAGKDSAWASQDTGPWTCEQMDNGTPEMNRITSPSLPAVSVVVRQIRRCCDTGASPAPPYDLLAGVLSGGFGVDPQPTSSCLRSDDETPVSALDFT